MADLKISVSDELEKELQLMVYATVQDVFEKSLKKELHSRDFLSLQDVCDYLQISKGTLHTWLNKYSLKRIQIGGRTFISKKSLIQFMETFEK